MGLPRLRRGGACPATRGTASLATFRSWPPFDGIYSISVIEHVPATVRRALLADISARTRLGGLVVLTIDLVRGSDELWNLNLGVEVEDLAVHGTFQDVSKKVRMVGLELFRDEVVRDWGESRSRYRPAGPAADKGATVTSLAPCKARVRVDIPPFEVGARYSMTRSFD